MQGRGVLLLREGVPPLVGCSAPLEGDQCRSQRAGELRLVRHKEAYAKSVLERLARTRVLRHAAGQDRGGSHPEPLREGGDPLRDREVHALSLIHISEPTRLRRISYAVFCLKK